MADTTTSNGTNELYSGITMPETIQTPRLLLHRMNDPSSAQQAQWFHRIWSSPDTTMWSPQGTTTSPADSLERFKRHNTGENANNMVYAVFAKLSEPDAEYPEGPGRLVGNLGLRPLAASLPPLPREGGDATKKKKNKKLVPRSLGYAYFEHAWGRGYATEAAKALLETYEAAVKAKLAASADDEEQAEYWVEAGWDADNPASGKVIAKLGFKEVGWYVEDTDELIFLGGKWRGPGYWIWGKWVD